MRVDVNVNDENDNDNDENVQRWCAPTHIADIQRYTLRYSVLAALHYLAIRRAR